MHHDLDLLVNIAVALCVAFVGGLLARRLGMPTLAGYLVAGLAIGPFTPGFVGDIEDIRQLAELGVIFMMFGVGLHFSLRDLWNVRGVAVPGAVAQILIATGMTYIMTHFWGWTPAAGLVMGLAVSIASTVVLLRGLTDNGLLNTVHGKVAVGWLVLEDLATVAILVVMPAMAGGEGEGSPLWSAAVALLKTAAFVAVMLVFGRRVLPWVLTRIANTRSRELFILAVMAASLGTTMAAAELFGMSLALGAFLAGLVIGESKVSHQVAAEALPFQEIFAVIFFVSVGMLVNPTTLLSNVGELVMLTLLIVAGKAVTTLLLGLVLPAQPRTMLVVAAGLSQIGEFSFIVGQAGLAFGLLSLEQYNLLLASALVSIVINPFLFRLIPGTEKALKRVAWLWKGLTWRAGTPEPPARELADHVVVVGGGRVGSLLVRLLEKLSVPILVVEIDPATAEKFQEQSIPVLCGDASNSELLTLAQLDKARALVVTVPSQSAAEMVVAGAHELAPKLAIVARASTVPGITRLMGNGAREVIHPELEGGLELMKHALLSLSYSEEQVERYTDAVRRETYYAKLPHGEEARLLSRLLTSVGRLGLKWVTVSPGSRLSGRTLKEIELRAETGASVVAMIRDQQATSNPDPSEPARDGDLLALLGSPEQLDAAEKLLQNPEPAPV